MLTVKITFRGRNNTMVKENPFEANIASPNSAVQKDTAYSALVNEAFDLKKKPNGGSTSHDLGAIAAVPVVLAAGTSYPWCLTERSGVVAPPAMLHPSKAFCWKLPQAVTLQPELKTAKPFQNFHPQIPIGLESKTKRDIPQAPTPHAPQAPLERNQKPPVQQQKPAEHQPAPLPVRPQQRPADWHPTPSRPIIDTRSPQPTDNRPPQPTDKQKPIAPGRPAEAKRDGDSRPEVIRQAKQPDKTGSVYELHDLKYSTGKHRTPDAMVYIPDGFDPKKPVRVMVYNHGLGTDVKEAFKNSKLQEQMKGGDPNTILVVPEWQTKTQSRESKDSDRFHDPQFFKNMMNEVFSKMPELAGKTTDDIASFGLITHSGGFRATKSELYQNGIYDKVTSLTVLDSMYDPKAYDKWVADNIDDLATGKKQLLVVYTDHLSGESNGLADRTKAMLKKSKHPNTEIGIDRSNPKTVTDAHTLKSRGINFKYSSLTDPGNDAHNTMTGHYVKEVIQSRMP